jgi:malate dehydrogenase
MNAEPAKIIVIGAGGDVGQDTAKALALAHKYSYSINGIFSDMELVLANRTVGKAEALALEIAHSFRGATAPKITVAPEFLASDPAIFRGADVIAFTAGEPRNPDLGETRMDVLMKNARFIAEAGWQLREIYEGEEKIPMLIQVVNPLDTLTWVMQAATGFPVAKVVGQAGMLDSSRWEILLKKILEEDFKCDLPDEAEISSSVIGSHDDDGMIPLLSQTWIYGSPLSDFLEENNIDANEFAKACDARIPELKATGAAIGKLRGGKTPYFSPAAQTVDMIDGFLRALSGRGSECTASRYVSGRELDVMGGMYGALGLYIGAPMRWTRLGAEPVGLDMSLKETAPFMKSVAAVIKSNQAVAEFLAAGGVPVINPKNLEPIRTEIRQIFANLQKGFAAAPASRASPA